MAFAPESESEREDSIRRLYQIPEADKAEIVCGKVVALMPTGFLPS